MSLELILTTFVITGAIVGFIALHSSFLLSRKMSSYVTWVYPLVVVVALTVAYKTVIDIQGFPVKDRPPVVFKYVGHVMEGQVAVVVARIEGVVKVYMFVPTEEEKKKLKTAEEGKKKGKQFMMQMIDGEPTKAELIRLDQSDPKD